MNKIICFMFALLLSSTVMAQFESTPGDKDRIACRYEDGPTSFYMRKFTHLDDTKSEPWVGIIERDKWATWNGKYSIWTKLPAADLSMCSQGHFPDREKTGYKYPVATNKNTKLSFISEESVDEAFQCFCHLNSSLLDGCTSQYNIYSVDATTNEKTSKYIYAQCKDGSVNYYDPFSK